MTIINMWCTSACAAVIVDWSMNENFLCKFSKVDLIAHCDLFYFNVAAPI